MKTIAYIVLLMATSFYCHGQSMATQHIGAAAQKLSGAQGAVTFHIGEMVAQDQGRIKSGVIQYIALSTILDAPIDLSSLRVFPNPTTGPIHIEHDLENIDGWMVCDAQGKVLKTIEETSNQLQVDLPFPSGSYYLLPLIEGQPQGGHALQIIR